MTGLPRFADLRAIAEAIGDQGEYRRVRSAIAKAALTQSCVSDLAEAETCCAALTELQNSIRRKGTMTRLATEAALLRAAVTLYERASAAGAKQGERGSVQIADRLTQDQRQDHDAIIQARHRALAHVYVGEDLGGTMWHRDVLFIVEDGEQWRPAAASNRIQVHGELFRRLRRQIPVALHILQSRFGDQIGRVTAILNDEPLPIELLENHLFDPIETFGSEATVQKVLAAQATGRGGFAGES